MLPIRNQLICLSIVLLLMVAFQSDQANGQIKKKKLLKGLMGASLLKLFKSKKGGFIPIPLPLPLPVEWNTQSGLLSKNNPPTHVSHQPYAGIQMGPIDYQEYQNAISQALSNSNTYVPSSYSNAGSSGNSYSAGQASNVGQNQEQSGYGSNSSPSNGYDGSSGSNDENANSYNSGPASYGVNGVNQNDEYNAYQISNNEQGYRAAASSMNANFHFNNQQQPSHQFNNFANYAQNYQQQNANQFNNDYSQSAPNQNNNEQDQQQYNNFQQNSPNQQSNYEDNSGSASSNSFVATNSQQNSYIPLRSVPIYHHHVQQSQSSYQPASSSNQPQMASNGWVALD